MWYFHAYQRIGERADLDLVIHLGDYIYEYGNGVFGELRDYEPPTEIVTLEDYRTRYAQYRREPELQMCHRQHPMVAGYRYRYRCRRRRRRRHRRCCRCCSCRISSTR